MTRQRYRTGPMKAWTEGLFHRMTDTAVRRWPQTAPPTRFFCGCRIVAHRGEHDNLTRLENTLPAFDAAEDAGAWGVEMDIRWTHDLVPVVNHDPDTRRVFARNRWIADTSHDHLKQHFPLIPTLAEVIERYGGRLHLMLEIKCEPYPRPAIQSRMMQQLLKDLAPGEDFHLMSLDPRMFAAFSFLPSKAFVPIARLRIDRFSRQTATQRWGGVAGHYFMTPRRLINRHHLMGQEVGTGFVDSRRCLFREVRRGVDWIFSNRAAALQTEIRRLRPEV